MGGACSAWGDEKCVLKRKDHSEDQCVDGRIILKWFKGK
jgi:hypothetical protein